MEDKEMMDALKQMVSMDQSRQVLDTCTDLSVALLEMSLQYKKSPKQIAKMFNEMYDLLSPIKR